MKTKQILCIVAFAFLLCACGNSKAGEKVSNSNKVESKKPTIMIVPNDAWCLDNRYVTDFTDAAGSTVRVSDYKKAFLLDKDLPGVISNIGQQMTNLGYSLKDCAQEVKSLETKQAEDNVTTSSSTGSTMAESPLDILKRKTKSDIVIQIGWVTRAEGSKRSYEFTIEAFDAYTNKRIATATGISKASDEIAARVLSETVKSYMKDFDKQLNAWYKDLAQSGREIVLNIRVWNNSAVNLETENEDGDEFIDVIQDWMKKNTIHSSFNYTDGSSNFAQFEQVRIPLFDEDGDPMDARAFATNLRKYLKSEYNVTSKVMVRGLGEAILVIGEK